MASKENLLMTIGLFTMLVLMIFSEVEARNLGKTSLTSRAAETFKEQNDVGDDGHSPNYMVNTFGGDDGGEELPGGGRPEGGLLGSRMPSGGMDGMPSDDMPGGGIGGMPSGGEMPGRGLPPSVGNMPGRGSPPSVGGMPGRSLPPSVGDMPSGGGMPVGGIPGGDGYGGGMPNGDISGGGEGMPGEGGGIPSGSDYNSGDIPCGGLPCEVGGDNDIDYDGGGGGVFGGDKSSKGGGVPGGDYLGAHI